MAGREMFAVMFVFVGLVVLMSWQAWKKDQEQKAKTRQESPSEEEKKLQEKKMMVFLLLMAAFAVTVVCVLANAVIVAVLIGLFVLITLPIWKAVEKSNKFNK